MDVPVSRRTLLTTTASVAAGLTGALAVAAPTPADEPFSYSLNFSTIRGQKKSVPEMIDIAARAGYTCIEPWVRDVEQYGKNGGSLADLRKRIDDHGLKVVSSIAFAEWIVDDDARRARGLEQAKRDMDTLTQIGGIRMAAPPTGATQQPGLDLMKAAERYRALLEVGVKMGVVPQLEVWGFSRNLSRLGEVAYVTVESRHPQACMLLDVYHLYKGGSDFEGLRLLSGAAMHVFHVNDYPASPPRATINDGDRVYPGDGVAPLGRILKDLHATGFRGVLSLELFNKTYWEQDALEVARTGLEKTRAVVRAALRA